MTPNIAQLQLLAGSVAGSNGRHKFNESTAAPGSLPKRDGQLWRTRCGEMKRNVGNSSIYPKRSWSVTGYGNVQVT